MTEITQRPAFEGATPTCPQRRWQQWTLILLIAAACAVFANVAGHQFLHFDDASNIYNNPHVTGLGREQIQWMLTDTTYAPRYMPVGWFCYALERQLFGLNPMIWHAGNVLLHAVNSILLFFLLKALLQRGARNPNGNPSTPILIAGLATLFWTIHPLRVETVAWASARIYQVVFFFMMLSLLAWLRAQDETTPMPRRRVFYYASLLAFAASLLTYPLAVFAPVVFFALEVFPLRRIREPLRGWFRADARRVWLDKVPFMVVSLGILVLTFSARSITDERFRPLQLAEFGVLPRVMQALFVCAYYAWKPLAPFGLSAVYPTLHAFNPADARFLLSALFVVGTSVAALALRRRWPAVQLLWICHVVLLLPVLGLSEYPHCAADRYSYLHGALWAVALAFLLQRLWAYERRGQVAGVVVAMASLCFGLLAWRDVPVWRDTISVYENIVARFGEHPSRARFDEVLGVFYLRAGRTNDAIRSFEAAAYYEARRQDRRLYEEKVLPHSHFRLAEIFLAQGRTDSAVEHYRAAAQADPASAKILLRLSDCLVHADRNAEALTALSEALRLEPDSPTVHHRLGLTLQKLGQYAEAQQHFADERRLLVGK